MNEDLVAPCGMNCGICANYLAEVHDVRAQGIRMPYCKGCRPRGKMCAYLKKRCNLLKHERIEFCHECQDLPCHELQTIDKRYRERYRMSLIENLTMIREQGLARFLKAQERKWRCPTCSGTISCHNGLCFRCDLDKLRRKKNK
jgi:hypothetical protein